ncbi:hypothetical protein BBF96_04700 [Anoxybacter fermentans]|uniref:Uncharacterized protein n=1 Tax=Anoxybacter fermentans TaxID=1323375 RepID=A0A3Q9HPH9_9FIRM|nr:hypothetical protein [Anoxybacter fermentans]AZR72752.1 hypothetical protein BBF96_04700 [Anoxybacter fermentans]
MVCLLNATGRFLMGLITVGLVLLITIQLMMGFEQTRHYLKWVESQVYELIDPDLKKVAVVIPEEYVILELLNPGNFSEVRVLVNNEKVYYFNHSIVRIPVKDGDLLIIDTRGIETALWFEVRNYSKRVSNLKIGQQFRVKNGLEVIYIKLHDETKF